MNTDSVYMHKAGGAAARPRAHWTRLLALLPALLALIAWALPGDAATVTTDRLDYPPFSDVYLSGAGWAPGETVAVHIDEVNGDGSLTPLWDATPPPVADSNGAFTVVWYIYSDEFIGATFRVTASGATSGTATTTFTDTGAGIAPVNPPTGGFGIEGDLYANTPTPGIGDWAPGTYGRRRKRSEQHGKSPGHEHHLPHHGSLQQRCGQQFCRWQEGE